MPKEHPLIETCEAFLKAVRDAQSDPCIGLNVGYHDTRILSAWIAFKKQTNKIPLLAEKKGKQK